LARTVSVLKAADFTAHFKQYFVPWISKLSPGHVFFEARDKWSRVAVRSHLTEQLRVHSPSSRASELQKIAIPGNLTLIEGWSYSISHTSEVGAYLLSDMSFSLGLDIEDTSRISVPVAKRVSGALEFVKAPTPAVLWVAKEASLKAARSTLITDVSIRDWKSQTSGVYEFVGQDLVTEKMLRGLVLQTPELSMAVAFQL
jgi:phosphopantetheinyl transferase (holo-ACP synthase)